MSGPSAGTPAGPLSGEERVGLRSEAAAVLDDHWRVEGFTCPNPDAYPFLWLWDSCFHAVVRAELGDERSVVELASVFAGQDPGSGFVPHMGYLNGPELAVDLWGRPGFSTITQPPMWGHATVELAARGFDVPDEVVERGIRGLRFLFDRRRRSPSGMIEIVHPWESGADDSPRWDDLIPGGFELARWRAIKRELIGLVERSPGGAPLANPAFAVAPVSFNALVAWNALLLGAFAGDDALVASAGELAAVVRSRWDDEAGTWVDDGPTAGGSGRACTLEALCPLLVEDAGPIVERVCRDLADHDAYGGAYGLAGVHRGEPSFSPGSYWRGPSWPQLDYLLWAAVRERGRDDLAATIAAGTARAARATGFAEYWDADHAEGGGATPQSWSTLAVVMDAATPRSPGRAGSGPGRPPGA